MTAAPIPAPQAEELTVFYDGACPLCRREIGFYRRQRGADAIAWVDVSAAADDTDVIPGLSKAQAMARFHVRDRDGALVDGGDAFARLWEALPRFRLLGRIGRLPPVAWTLARAYDLFLKGRPRLQAVFVQHDVDAGEMPAWLRAELRSDHAGETGAVAIYRGILAVARDPAVRAIAQAHLETEETHLRKLNDILPPRDRSQLLPAWRLAGALTGGIPALFGAKAVYATIDAVESFVDRHYAAQIDRLADCSEHAGLRDLLQACRNDELHHRDDARARLKRRPGPVLRAWCWLVGKGSAAAVAVARRV